MLLCGAPLRAVRTPRSFSALAMFCRPLMPAAWICRTTGSTFAVAGVGFVGFTNPIEGQEDAFNAWYSDVHLKDVLKVPGIVAAQRFKLSDVQRDQPPFPWRYLALYEIETDDLNHTLAALRERAGTSAMVISAAVAPDRVGWFFQPITSKLEG